MGFTEPLEPQFFKYSQTVSAPSISERLPGNDRSQRSNYVMKPLNINSAELGAVTLFVLYPASLIETKSLKKR